jgi:hypothetical protein
LFLPFNLSLQYKLKHSQALPLLGQIVKEIAEKVTTANPGPNETFVEQILTELTRQSAQVYNQGNVLDEIYSQVSAYPYGIVSQSLARFARALSTDI